MSFRSADSPSVTLDRAGRRCAWAIVAMLLVSLPFLIFALLNTTTSSTDIHPWFPDNTVEREQYLLYDQLFGPEDYWILSSEQQSNQELMDRLAEEIRFANAEEETPLLRRIRSSSDFLEDLPESQRKVAKEKLRGVFFDEEGTRGVVFAEASEYGFRNRGLVYEKIFEPILQEYEPDETLRLMGPGFVGVMADRETKETFLSVTPITFAVSSLLAFFLLGNVRFAVIAILTSGIAAVGSIAVVYYSGHSLSHLLVVVPSLAQLLALSNAIHLIHYYCDAEKNIAVTGPAWREALREGVRPTVAASLTTVIGFLTLLSSSLPVVRSFSIFGSIGVFLTMVVVLTLVPSGLILLRPRPDSSDWIDRRVIPFLDRTVRRFRMSIALLLLTLFAGSFFGFRLLETEIRTETFFSDESELQQHFQWFNREFGHLQASQLVGKFDGKAAFADQLKAVATLETSFQNSPDEFKVYAPVSLMQQAAGGLAPLDLMEETLREERLLQSHENANYWIVTIYHEPIEEMSGSKMDQEIDRRIEDLTAEYPGSTWFVTGTYRLFGNAQELLVTELLKTFALAFLLITPCIIFYLRDIKLGLVATLGNVFPIVVFFGCLGCFGVSIDIATMVIASIAFGIAVDDTIHFLNSFIDARYRGDRPLCGVVSLAFRKSGAAILKTTLIISGGMLVFMLSDFGPSRRFALFTSLVLVLAAVGDLLLLPALFRGVFSRFLKR